MLSRQRATGEALYKRLATAIADQFLRGHRFAQDLPGLEGSRSERVNKP